MNKRYRKSNTLIDEALKYIPLGSQTFSKSITQFPKGVSPLFIDRGQGSHVWDIDGNEYIDFVSGLCSVTIGYNDKKINNAVISQLSKGVNFSLPHSLELKVAKLLVDLIPGAEMVRFGKNGTDATSAAIRLARAFTKRNHIAVCGYHGWQDWYIGKTTKNLGVPEQVSKLTHHFKYNDVASLINIFEKFPNDMAAVIMEPMNTEWPKNNYLQQVKEITKSYGSIFILDENVTGFRFSKGGAQKLFGIDPDLSTFGKGMGNGFPLSAVVGKKDIMSLMNEIFFSGTFGGETVSLSATSAVLEMIKNTDVIDKIHATGELVVKSVTRCIENHCLGNLLEIKGHPSWSFLTIKNSDSFSALEIKTLIMQEMFKRGILFTGSHNISYSHSEEDVTKLLSAYDEVFELLKRAVDNSAVGELLEVEPIQQLFSVRQ